MAQRTRIAILGATGHVGKVLTDELLKAGDCDLTTVGRNAGKLEAFLESLPNGDHAARHSLDDWAAGEYDVVINCLGVGDPAQVAAIGADIFTLTEQFDSIAMRYLDAHRDTLCINFSSGAAYCGDFSEPANDSTPAVVDINHITPSDYYGVAKLVSEVRHRAATHLRIVDLRLFGLFTRHIDTEARYFMNDVVRAIGRGTVLETDASEMRRDYVDPHDLAALVQVVVASGGQNDVFDIYSGAPIAKSEVLTAFGARYGLTWAPRGDEASITGSKPEYYSASRQAGRVGYQPTSTSLETLFRETDALLGARTSS